MNRKQYSKAEKDYYYSHIKPILNHIKDDMFADHFRSHKYTPPKHHFWNPKNKKFVPPSKYDVLPPTPKKSFTQWKKHHGL